MKAFDQYEVLWEEEREDINEAYSLKTDFDFKEANRAVQKTLNKQSETTQPSQKDAGFDDWGDSSTNAKSSKNTNPYVPTDAVSGLDNDY